MTIEHPALPLGYHAVPEGKIATVVTCLEMLHRPPARIVSAPDSLRNRRWSSAPLDQYRALFRAIGERWLWVSRLEMPDEKLAEILHDPRVEVHVLEDGNRPVGLVELDFREENTCELAFFGLVADAIGKGAGRFMMNHAIETAWSKPIRRFWVHTCHLDSPEALPFYQRSGFKPFALKVEIMDDPRLTGTVARDTGFNVPLIELQTA